MSSYYSSPLSQWVLDWPGQAVVCCRSHFFAVFQVGFFYPAHDQSAQLNFRKVLPLFWSNHHNDFLPQVDQLDSRGNWGINVKLLQFSEFWIKVIKTSSIIKIIELKRTLFVAVLITNRLTTPGHWEGDSCAIPRKMQQTAQGLIYENTNNWQQNWFCLIKSKTILINATSRTNMMIKSLREDINGKKTFSFGHCPNEGGGLPMPEFLALFQEVHFWSIKRVYFFKNANVLNF